MVAVYYRDEAGNFTKKITYREAGERAKALSQGLLSLGLNKGDKVSLLSETRYEWMQADIAILTAGGVTVTIFPTLSPTTVQYIANHSDSKMIFVENQEQLNKVLLVWEELPQLKEVIVFEPLITKPRANIYTLSEVMEMGRQFEASNPGRYEKIWRSVKPEDLSSFVYTSGTTGPPKGVMLSHWNWCCCAISLTQVISFTPREAALAFLPLAHVYARVAYFAMLKSAVTVYVSSPKDLAEDLPRVRPVTYCSVPRIYERFYDRIIEQIESTTPPFRRKIRKKIFFWAAGVARDMGEVRSRWKKPSLKLKLKHRLASPIYWAIRKKAGMDRLRGAISGGAALRKELAYFLNGMGITILEGYGMSENAGPATVNPIGRSKVGTVGIPLPGVVTIKIAEDGEILIKGDNVMQGYYKLPEETRQSFTKDGWLKTGDIGYFDEDNYLVFKERKKHLLVLSTGKNVAPLPIEEELKKSRWIEEAVVIGDNEKFVSALIQPAYQLLLEFARERNIEFSEELTKFGLNPAGEEVPIQVDEKLLRNGMVIEIFQRVIDEANLAFDDYEQVKKFRLLNNAVSVKTGELTPTLKVKRSAIGEKYKDLISEIYA
ncbi:long-chain fatty acid--CoA ligase [Dehalococcoidia bacterium]|nr:long-chain fatty acid--CoA ligase [Dehalococcoidia bacterium]MCL0097956.1 long-chain fatty acid--CoA ligase [Dehalococcoidia bacterium]